MRPSVRWWPARRPSSPSTASGDSAPSTCITTSSASWDLVTPEGAVVVAGVDIGALASDGRLRRITGFFGEVPAATTA